LRIRKQDYKNISFGRNIWFPFIKKILRIVAFLLIEIRIKIIKYCDQKARLQPSFFSKKNFVSIHNKNIEKSSFSLTKIKVEIIENQKARLQEHFCSKKI